MFNYYKKTHATAKEMPNIPRSEPLSSPSPQPVNTDSAKKNTGTWSDKPYVSPYAAEDSAYDELINAVNNGASQEEINNKMENFNKASQQRQELDNDLDDFYDRQNDGFGGQ